MTYVLSRSSTKPSTVETQKAAITADDRKQQKRSRLSIRVFLMTGASPAKAAAPANRGRLAPKSGFEGRFERTLRRIHSVKCSVCMKREVNVPLRITEAFSCAIASCGKKQEIQPLQTFSLRMRGLRPEDVHVEEKILVKNAFLTFIFL